MESAKYVGAFAGSCFRVPRLGVPTSWIVSPLTPCLLWCFGASYFWASLLSRACISESSSQSAESTRQFNGLSDGRAVLRRQTMILKA